MCTNETNEAKVIVVRHVGASTDKDTGATSFVCVIIEFIYCIIAFFFIK